MRNGWHFIVGFAAFGLVITAVIVTYQDSSSAFDAPVHALFVILCPPSLLCIPFNAAMKDNSQFYVVWSLIGLLNGWLYAAIGTAIVWFWKSSLTKPD